MHTCQLVVTRTFFGLSFVAAVLSGCITVQEGSDDATAGAGPTPRPARNVPDVSATPEEEATAGAPSNPSNSGGSAGIGAVGNHPNAGGVSGSYSVASGGAPQIDNPGGLVGVPRRTGARVPTGRAEAIR